MADQFSKKNILAKLREKVQAKGFDLSPDKSKMSKSVMTIADLLDILADSLSIILSQEEARVGTIKAKSLKLGPSGLQKAASTKEMRVKFDITTDPKFFGWMESLHGILQGVYPEAGYGAPNVFNMALKTLAASKPTSLTGKITEGSSKVKATI